MLGFLEEAQSEGRLVVRNRHEALLANKKKNTKKSISLQQFRDGVTNDNMKWTVINGSVYDLTTFITIPGTHPGGDFLDEFVGIDATLYFYTVHIKSSHVWAKLRTLWVGYLVESDNDKLASKADKQLMDLINELDEKGLFTYPLMDLIVQIIGTLLLMVAQMVYAVHAFRYATTSGERTVDWSLIDWTALGISIVYGALAYLLSAYVFHDAGHQSLFSTKKLNRQFIDWYGFPFMGYVVSSTFEVHDYHHCFPNVVTRDNTLNTGIFKWHPDQLEPGQTQLPPNYSIWAPVIWHAFVLWLYVPIEVRTIITTTLNEKKYFAFSLAMIRVAVVFGIPIYYGYTWHVGAIHFFAMMIAGYVMAITSTFNHLAELKENVTTFRESTLNERRSFVRHQAGKTRNMNRLAIDNNLISPTLSTSMDQQKRYTIQYVISSFCNQIICWASGHFNYHIEHHMIPYLPRQRLPLIAGRIRAICQLEEQSVPPSSSSKQTAQQQQQQGINLYNSTDYLDSLTSVFNAVAYPFDILGTTTPSSSNSKSL